MSSGGWSCDFCTLINERPMSLVCEACQSLRRPKRSAPPVDSASLAPATSIIQSSSTESTKRRRLESLSVSQDIGKAFTSTVRLTATATSKNALRIQDLIVKDELQRAFLSTFCIDDGWLEEFLPSNKNVCLALHRRGQNSSGEHIVFSPYRSVVYPPLGQYGCMHIKLFLLWYPTYLRVAIPSANLVKFDWDTIENILWYQDFPLSKGSVSNEKTRFQSDLEDLLGRMTVPKSIIEALKPFDFSKATARLVASIPGTYSGSDLHKYGHVRLANLVHEILPKESVNEERVVCYQTSSLGAMSNKWAHSFFDSCSGQRLQDRLQQKADKNRPLPRLQIVFPTDATVRGSALGANGGGTIMFNRKHWDAFPQSLMRSCKSTQRPIGPLMHSKIILGYPVTSPPRIVLRKNGSQFAIHSKGDHSRAWIYLGSHNSTQSAWGNVSKARASGKDQLSINNWELGVVLPITLGSQDGDVSQEAAEASQLEIPIPFEFPPQIYGQSDTPWFADLS